jgi:hypothetical protein
VSSDSNKQESLYIQNDESKELERDSVENTLFNELEKLINDKNFKSYSEYFSEDKLNFINTEDCCWLFNRALLLTISTLKLSNFLLHSLIKILFSWTSRKKAVTSTLYKVYPQNKVLKKDAK